MKVFISWSGERAKKVATVWKQLITEVFDDVVAFMSEEDIGAGERGLSKVATELAGTNFGIIVVTPGNQNSQWLNYEAGALSKGVDDQTVRVAPSLVGFKLKSDSTGPLAQFQGTLLNAEGIERILVEIAKVAGVNQDSVRKRFRWAWGGDYEDLFSKASSPIDRSELGRHRPAPEVLDEILTLARGISRSIGVATWQDDYMRLPLTIPVEEIRSILESFGIPQEYIAAVTLTANEDGSLKVMIPFETAQQSKRGLESLTPALMLIDGVGRVQIESGVPSGIFRFKQYGGSWSQHSSSRDEP